MDLNHVLLTCQVSQINQEHSIDKPCPKWNTLFFNGLPLLLSVGPTTFSEEPHSTPFESIQTSLSFEPQ